MRKFSLWWRALIVALLVGGVFSLFASQSPDGLERVAINHGFMGQATHLFDSVISNYSFSWFPHAALTQTLVRFFGTVLVFGLLYGIAWFLNRKQKES